MGEVKEEVKEVGKIDKEVRIVKDN